jgi:hypothetical protein
MGKLIRLEVYSKSMEIRFGMGGNGLTTRQTSSHTKDTTTCPLVIRTSPPSSVQMALESQTRTPHHYLK